MQVLYTAIIFLNRPDISWITAMAMSRYQIPPRLRRDIADKYMIAVGGVMAIWLRATYETWRDG